MKCSNDATSQFCQQMAMMIDSGLSIEEGLGILESDSFDSTARQHVTTMKNEVQQGSSFADSLEKCAAFDPYLIKMVRIGETTGYLDQVLLSLSHYYNRMEKIRISLKNALTYPLILLVMVFLVVGVILFKVLPIFNQVLNNLGVSLSPIALFIMDAGHVLIWGSVLIGVVVVLFFVSLWLKHRQNPARSFMSLCSNLPLIKGMSRELACAQSAYALSLFTKSGYDVSEALAMTQDIIDHPKVNKSIAECLDWVNKKESLDIALVKSKLFKESYSRMIGVGFKAGRTDEMISLIAEKYEEDTETAVNHFLNIIEPLLIGILSIVVGMILLSVMLPLMNIMSSIG